MGKIKTKETAWQLLNGAADSSTWKRFVDHYLRDGDAEKDLHEAWCALEVDDVEADLLDAVTAFENEGTAGDRRAALLRILSRTLILITLDERDRGDRTVEKCDARISDAGYYK